MLAQFYVALIQLLSDNNIRLKSPRDCL